MFVMPCAIVAILSLCLSLLCFSLMVGTRSRPYGLCHHSYSLAHIKGFGSPLFATPKSSRGASNEPHMRGSVATAGGKIKAHNDGSFLPRSRLSVDITYIVSLKQSFLFIGLERKRVGWEWNGGTFENLTIWKHKKKHEFSLGPCLFKMHLSFSKIGLNPWLGFYHGEFL